MRIRATLAAVAAASVLMSGSVAMSAAADPLGYVIIDQVAPPAFSAVSGQTWKPVIRTAEPVTWTLTVRAAPYGTVLHTQSSNVATTTVAPVWNGKDTSGKVLNQVVHYTLQLWLPESEPVLVTGTVNVVGTLTTLSRNTPTSFTPDGDKSVDTWNTLFRSSRPVTWNLTINKTTGAGVGDGSNAWGGYTNGKIAASALCSLSWARADLLRCDATAGLEKINAAYKAAFGTNISITDTYRPYTEQVAVHAKYGYPRAAIPGTSDHGWALAADLGGGINQFNTAQYNWMKANAPQHGWVHPARAEPGGKYPEPWHWVWDNGRGADVVTFRQDTPSTRFAPVWDGKTGTTLNADGTYSWILTANDGVTPATTVSGTVNLRARPVTTTVRPALYSSDTRNDGRIAVSWSAPPTVGVTGWNVSYRRVTANSRGSRVYGTTYRWLSNTKATSATFGGTPGITYQFFVTPVDSIRPKNTAGTALSHLTFDDRSFAYSTGWVNQSVTGRYRSTLKSSATKGKTASMVFYGTGFKIIGDKGTTKGQFYLSIDGARPVLVDTYATSARAKQSLYAKALPGGRHTVKITVVGTNRRPTVSLDGIGITH